MTDPSGQNPEITIIVVSYNTQNLTLPCLQSILDETRASIEIIIVDNASTDGSAAMIMARFPQVYLLAEEVNHGFAQANNLAICHVRGDYILLLNPDTLVLGGAIDRLLDFAKKRPEARIWGGRTVFADGRLNKASCWRRMTLWSLFCNMLGLTKLFPDSDIFNAEAYGGWDRSSEREVDIVSGCFLMISRTDWQVLGGFDPSFFMYGEEADLCLRARRRIAARPRITPEATIIHYEGASEQVMVERIIKVLRAKNALIQRHFPIWQRPLAQMLFAAAPLSRHFAGKLRSWCWPKPDGESVWTEVWRRRTEWRTGSI